MWIFTRYGFFSLSLKPNGAYQIRARARAHLVALKQRFNGHMPGLKAAHITFSKTNDYPYRVVVPQREAAKLLSELVKEQEWDNFKSEVGRYRRDELDGSDYIAALHDVWARMRQFEVDIMWPEQKKKMQPRRRQNSLFHEFERLKGEEL